MLCLMILYPTFLYTQFLFIENSTVMIIFANLKIKCHEAYANSYFTHSKSSTGTV
jgi:hypothetical protein